MSEEKTKFYNTNGYGYQVVHEGDDAAFGEMVKLFKEMAKTEPAKTEAKYDNSKKVQWEKCTEHNKWYDGEKYDKCSICANKTPNSKTNENIPF